MKHILYIAGIFIFCIASSAKATPQTPDIIIKDGVVYALHSQERNNFPLEDLWSDPDTRPKTAYIGPHTYGFTACGREYIAYWSIESGELFLKGLSAWYGDKRAELRELFPERFKDGKVKADWFSGLLVLSKPEYYPKKWTTILKFEKGNLIPGNSPPVYGLPEKGVEYGSRGKFDYARAEFDEARKFSRSDDIKIHLRVIEHVKSKKLEPVIAACYFKARSYEDEGLFDKAFTEYNKVITKKPIFVEAYIGRAPLYSRNREWDKALSDYNKAIELDPNYSVVYAKRGLHYYFSMKQVGNAIDDYTKAIELNPLDYSVYNLRSWAYRKTGEYEKANADLYKIKELQAKDND